MKCNDRAKSKTEAKAKSNERWNAGGIKVELRGEASLAEEKAAASLRTPYGIWCYLRCGFYGAGGGAGGAWVARFCDCAS